MSAALQHLYVWEANGHSAASIIAYFVLGSMGLVIRSLAGIDTCTLVGTDARFLTICAHQRALALWQKLVGEELAFVRFGSDGVAIGVR